MTPAGEHTPATAVETAGASRPSISVCVPTYNGADYLAECLDSVLAQTFADFEVIVVDDGSRDGSVALAERYAERDPRVRVHRNPRNLGLVGNWERCVELARGEWIKFVFQDDLIAPACLERMVAAGREGFPLVACARDFLFDEGVSEGNRRFFEFHRQLIHRVLERRMSADAFCRVVLAHPELNMLGEPTVVLMHRGVFSRFGPFNRHMVQMVDGEYWARVGTAVGVAYLDEPLATFRVHAASTTVRNQGSARWARTSLDPLVLFHEYAFSPAYENLRRVCRADLPGRDLARDLRRGLHQRFVGEGVAAALLKAQGRERAEAEAVFAAYPRLRIDRRTAIRVRAVEWVQQSRWVMQAYRRLKRVARRPG